MTDARTRAHELARSLIQWKQALDAPLPPVTDSARSPIVIAPGEMWCRQCGSDGIVLNRDVTGREHVRCSFCRSRDLIPAEQVLHQGEYVHVC